jgi:hypothetical protein
MNPWKGLDKGPGYRVENLGRPAVFFIPSYKLRKYTIGEETVEEHLHAFLAERFSAFTTTTAPFAGYWKDAKHRLVADESRMYKVSFVGKDRIPELFAKLGEICTVIEEDCLYVEAGQYAGLLYPAAVERPREVRIRSPRVVRRAKKP